MPSLAAVIFLWCACFFTFSTQAATLESSPCYRYDGTLNDYSYKGFDKFFSCKPEQEVSHCCYGLDLCLDNGLCMGFSPDLKKDRVLTLAGCTNPSWPLPCPQHFVRDRHDVPDGWPKITLWACNTYSEYCVSSKEVAGVDPGGASCCANTSLRITGIPWQKSMHMAMDPSRRIDIYTGELPMVPGYGGGNDSGLRDLVLTVVVIVLAVIAVLIGYCQWQFPKLRLWGWIRRRRTGTRQAAPSYQGNAADSVGAGGAVGDSDTVADVEASAEPSGTVRNPNTPSVQVENPFESYRDSIRELLEIEDGWRER
ncbi:hypothetical protein B0T26DRAFT_673674 [Lasiosphaeria miniovina]|uniref:Uncharacterized protein n=1 Tax=Lasiosphaeria miniovina TaxID=1954250 RepID=A0AA40DZX8_9PEZI|nr:uncharacterized protein B0T26DRAFT_673674 [Lasiosphaeria miniovina]KAK0721910.1 hypothetical protein B0T26DRAFT_673674 [Lasiosphaeria miniovina]